MNYIRTFLDEEDRVVPEKNDFNMYHEKLNIFTPKPGQFEGVDTFINGCRKAIVMALQDAGDVWVMHKQ